MEKKIIFFLSITFGLMFLICLFSSKLMAQQLPIFQETELLTSLSNPSKPASNFYKYDYNVNASAVYRYQWVALDDAPKTTVANFDYLAEDLNIIWGGSFINDQTGKMSFTGLFLKGAYTLYFNKDLQIYLGLSGGLLQYRLKASELTLLETGDIAVENETKMKPDFSMGATVYFQKKYFIGFSIPQTMGLNSHFNNLDNNFNIKSVRHYYGMAGMHLPLNKEDWLETTAWVRYVPNIPLHYGVNVKKEFFEKFWLGTGIASSGEFSIEAGLIILPGLNYDMLRIGYMASHYFKDYGPYFGTAHELKVSYSFQH